MKSKLAIPASFQSCVECLNILNDWGWLLPGVFEVQRPFYDRERGVFYGNTSHLQTGGRIGVCGYEFRSVIVQYVLVTHKFPTIKKTAGRLSRIAE